MTILIKDIPKNDRPIERLINNGVENLSNTELLTILLKTGTKDKSAKALAEEILKNVDSIEDLKNYDLESFSNIKGIGKVKAASILAAMELGKRINEENIILNDLQITNSQLVFNYYKNKIGSKLQEYFYCIYLNTAKKVIKDKLLFIGTVNQSIVHPREIFKEAYLLSASSIICVHNHPAGSVFPSQEDIKLTNKLVEIGNLLGVKIVDHVIITRDNYYSFFENNDIR